ncbi:hypothetical protein, partial [Serratia marcescens]|uniref:hypothetical protein n=3 Tax=Enterobacterales TaxID=91347 RepID=UPI0013DCB99D
YTTPLQRNYVNARIDDDGILDLNHYGSGGCFLAECSISVKETTYGFSENKKSEPVLYDDDNILSRIVNTSGVILRIPELAGQDEGRYAIGHE